MNKWYWPFPIARSLHGSAAIVFGREVYGDDSNKFIDAAHTFFRNISDLIYEFKYRFVKAHKHNVIYTDLKPGFWCEDSRLLYGCMKCLTDHVENEGGEEEFSKWTEELLNAMDEHKEMLQEQGGRQAEILAIYRWWKYEKPKDEKKAEELLEKVYGNHTMEFEDIPEHPGMSRLRPRQFTEDQEKAKAEMELLDQKIEDDEQKMLHRLIDIRRSLWT